MFDSFLGFTEPDQGIPGSDRLRVKLQLSLLSIVISASAVLFAVSFMGSLPTAVIWRYFNIVLCGVPLHYLTRSRYYRTVYRVASCLCLIIGLHHAFTLAQDGHMLSFFPALTNSIIFVALGCSFILPVTDVAVIVFAGLAGTGIIYWLCPGVPTATMHEAIQSILTIDVIVLGIVVMQRRLESTIRTQTIELSCARDQALECARAKSAFVTTMSHEIRTPLNGIIGLTALLGTSNLDADQRQWVENVKTSGTVLLGLANQILDFSRIEAGKLTLNKMPFDLRRAMEDVVQVCGITANPNVTVMSVVDAELPKMVTGDITRIQQIVINLLGNASKFTEEGEIIVRISQAALAPVNPEQQRIAISVTDSGAGMTPDELRRIFHPFTQVGESSLASPRRNSQGGVGLGLTIAQRLVGLMDGFIDVKSTKGVGTTFTAEICVDTLPADSPLQGSSEEDEETQRYRARLKGSLWAIACRNPRVSAAYCDMLESWGVHVIVLPYDQLNSAEELVACMKELARLPTGVIIDLPTPVPYAEHLQEALSLTAVTVLPLNDPYRLNVLATRMQVVRKPLRSSELQGAVFAAISGRRPSLRHLSSSGSLPRVPLRIPASVLVAEDAPVNQLLMRLMLTQLGCKVDIVDNGAQALHAITSSRNRGGYDMVLMDCQMPVMDGMTATRAIRQHEKESLCKPLPIIAVTASAMSEELSSCRDSGMSDHLPKPLTPHSLSAMIAKWYRVDAPLNVPWSEGA